MSVLAHFDLNSGNTELQSSTWQNFLKFPERDSEAYFPMQAERSEALSGELPPKTFLNSTLFINRTANSARKMWNGTTHYLGITNLTIFYAAALILQNSIN